MNNLPLDIEEYILKNIDKENELLYDLYRSTHTSIYNPQMVSGHWQGRILSMLCRIKQPKTVLEIGTFTGYSTLCMAAALPPEGKLFTIEINDELEDFTVPFFEKSGFADRIEMIFGNALTIIPTLQTQFDMVFIDGDKREYCNYYDSVFEKVNTGGLIIADNVLWDGKVTNPDLYNDDQTKGITAFNNKISNDNRIEKVIIPIRDGMSLIYKK